MKKFISLFSGGLDSPIAVYLMIKKGLNPILLTFLTSDDNEHSMRKKIIKVVEKLTKFTDDEIKLYLINHDPNLEILKEKCDRKLTCVLCKRLMIRIAKTIGKSEGTNIIVTGDILGEQASQTLDNLYAYNNLMKDHILLRPLIGRDKLEIIKMNENIGLYEIISKSSAGCQYNPQFPETHARISEVRNVEKRIEMEDLIIRSLKNAEILII